jgi:serine/threonine protein kinase
MTSVEHIRTRVLDLISKHEPDKTDSVDVLMKKWKGKENDLLKTLCEKYKEKYSKMPAVQIKKMYSIGSKLGTGGFAVVRKCKRRSDGVVFALKVINKKNLDKDDLVILESEVNIMRQVTHDNIIKLFDIFDSRSKMCLVLELLEGGELFDRIIEKGHFSEADASRSFVQMVEALEYLHSKQIVHRDLKPENLLFATKAANAPIKLIDFGLAGSCKDGLLKTPCGTPNYVAPEILRRAKYGTQADMWSIGVILYIILCGFPPFYDENDDLGRLYRKIKRAEYDMPSPYWDSISKGAKDLVRKLLQPDPKKRLTSKNTLEHPWCKGKQSTASLGDNHAFHLKRFQYIRRLRRGVRCILAVLRLIEALQQKKEPAAVQQSEAAQQPEAAQQKKEPEAAQQKK